MVLIHSLASPPNTVSLTPSAPAPQASQCPLNMPDPFLPLGLCTYHPPSLRYSPCHANTSSPCWVFPPCHLLREALPSPGISSPPTTVSCARLYFPHQEWCPAHSSPSRATSKRMRHLTSSALCPESWRCPLSYQGSGKSSLTQSSPRSDPSQ